MTRDTSTTKRHACVTLLVTVIAVLGMQQESAGQFGSPEWWGQWAGPYTLSAMGSAAEGNAEIAHAAVLPPPTEGASSRVLFFTRQGSGICTATDEYVTGWLWLPRTPTNATAIVDINSPGDASEDPFCSGHTFLPDGSLLVVGGQDYPNKCSYGIAYGHNAVRRLDTSVDPPVWFAPQVPQLLIHGERWYPTAITLANGDVFIPGHGVNALPPGSPDPTDRTYDRLTWAGPTQPLVAQDLVVNRAQQPPPLDCLGTNPTLGLSDYPRVHLLSTGEVFWADSNPARSSFLNVKTPNCLPGSPIPDHWDTTLTAPEVPRKGGSTVHIVYPDPALLPNTWVPRDVIYAIGGTDGKDDENCNPEGSIFDSVEKIDAPSDPTSMWVGSGPSESPPDLTYARYNHNSILLLDGSILVNGGWGEPFDCLEDADLILPERFRPPELFTGPLSDTWTTFGNADPHHRRYHSVAGLLPDGRVFSAGGQAPTPGSGHSVSIYSPPYAFFPRPVITLYPTTTIKYGDPPFEVKVTLSDASSSVKRVALVRNGSITHAWDMNQRYVELEITLITGEAPNLTLLINPPVDGYMAPPGYYLLTVVEKRQAFAEGKWVPSPAVWVRVDAP